MGRVSDPGGRPAGVGRGRVLAWRGMRLWSLHPRHLDAKGLVALWREGLLALAVAKGRTRGYRHHPQLVRFLAKPDPVAAIERYLLEVHAEAKTRGYSFDRRKLGPARARVRWTVSQGQLRHEWTHLLGKLERRDPERWRQQRAAKPVPHPLFRVVPGKVAAWERISPARKPA